MPCSPPDTAGRLRGGTWFHPSPDRWGQGFATEAARALAHFGFSQLRLARISATCRPENVASAGVLRKLGMEQVGRLKNDRLIRGSWLDTLVFAVDAAGSTPTPFSADT